VLQKNKNKQSDDPSGTIIDFRTHKKIRQRRNTLTGWSGFAAIPLAAWAIALPMIGGALVGRWIDSQWPTPFPWSVALMLVGAAIGCLIAWKWARH